MPHGSPLVTDSGFAVPAGGIDIPGISPYLEVAAYRSLAVAIKNTGGFAVTVTPRWDWFDGATSFDIDAAASVAAGASSRLLFQNRGDLLTRVRLVGVGGNTTVSYYLTGSNLDPFQGNAIPLAHLAGVAAGAQVSATGTPFNVQFLQSPAFSLITDDSVFSLNTVAPGVTDTVTLKTAGVYLATAAFSFAGAAAFNRQASIVMRNGGVPPRPNAPNLDGNAANENDFALADLLPVSEADAAAGAATVQVSGVQASGGPVTIQAGMLRIVRLSAVGPL